MSLFGKYHLLLHVFHSFPNLHHFTDLPLDQVSYLKLRNNLYLKLIAFFIYFLFFNRLCFAHQKSMNDLWVVSIHYFIFLIFDFIFLTIFSITLFSIIFFFFSLALPIFLIIFHTRKILIILIKFFNQDLQYSLAFHTPLGIASIFQFTYLMLHLRHHNRLHIYVQILKFYSLLPPSLDLLL